ncbi:MAG: CAP domain-containing protein [Thermotogota bacterium]
MRIVLTITLLIFFLLTVVFSATVETLTLEEVRSQYLDYVNDYRKKRGLNELEQRFSYIAQSHASDQAAKDHYNAHRGFNERADQIMALLKEESTAEKTYFGFLSVAENCCYFPICPDPAKQAFQQFISSPSHRRNLLKRFQYTAIGIDQGESGCFYFCQLFF